MMFHYMLDTDTSSYIMNRSNDAVIRRLRTVPVSGVCISAITKCELMYGVEASPRRQKNEAELAAFLKFVRIFDFPEAAGLDYAQIRAFLKARGRIIGANDLFIAAHARCLGFTLVTNKTREFARVPGLKIENWA